MFTSYPQAAVLLSWLALAFSIAACMAVYRKTDLGPIRRKLAALELQQNILEAESSQLQAAWKRTNARLAMAQAREKAKNGTSEDGLPDPADDPEGWRAAVRSKFLIKR